MMWQCDHSALGTQACKWKTWIGFVCFRMDPIYVSVDSLFSPNWKGHSKCLVDGISSSARMMKRELGVLITLATSLPSVAAFLGGKITGVPDVALQNYIFEIKKKSGGPSSYFRNLHICPLDSIFTQRDNIPSAMNIQTTHKSTKAPKTWSY